MSDHRGFLLDEGALGRQSTPRWTTGHAFEPSTRIARCRDAIPQWSKMKKVLEIIAVTVVVLGLIGAGVLLSRRPGSDVPTAPGGAEDEGTTPSIIFGAP